MYSGHTKLNQQAAFNKGSPCKVVVEKSPINKVTNVKLNLSPSRLKSSQIKLVTNEKNSGMANRSGMKSIIL